MSPEKGMCVYSQLHRSGNTLYVSPTTGICPLVCVSWIQTRLSATKHYYGSKGDLNWPESKQHAALDTLSMSNTLFENIKATIMIIIRSGLFNGLKAEARLGNWFECITGCFNVHFWLCVKFDGISGSQWLACHWDWNWVFWFLFLYFISFK